MLHVACFEQKPRNGAADHSEPSPEATKDLANLEER
jgi:hypothetical protein